MDAVAHHRLGHDARDVAAQGLDRHAPAAAAHPRAPPFLMEIVPRERQDAPPSFSIEVEDLVGGKPLDKKLLLPEDPRRPPATHVVSAHVLRRGRYTYRLSASRRSSPSRCSASRATSSADSRSSSIPQLRSSATPPRRARAYTRRRRRGQAGAARRVPRPARVPRGRRSAATSTGVVGANRPHARARVRRRARAPRR